MSRRVDRGDGAVLDHDALGRDGLRDLLGLLVHRVLASQSVTGMAGSAPSRSTVPSMRPYGRSAA